MLATERQAALRGPCAPRRDDPSFIKRHPEAVQNDGFVRRAHPARGPAPAPPHSAAAPRRSRPRSHSSMPSTLRIAASRARSPIVAASASADSNAGIASPGLVRALRPREAFARVQLASRVAPLALQRQHDLPRVARPRRAIVRSRIASDARPHFRLRHAVFELREQLRRFLKARQRLLVPRQPHERVAEHPQRLHQTIGVPGATAQTRRRRDRSRARRRSGPAAAGCAQSTSDGTIAGSAGDGRARSRRSA